MSFASLKQARQSRQAHLVSTETEQTVASQHRDVTAPNSSLSTASDELYGTLPPFLEIRSSNGTRGRGIFVKNTESGGSKIKRGTTLLSVAPHASALSTRNLTSYCSYCNSAPPSSTSSLPLGNVDDESNVNLRRCTKCKVIWYCSAACQNADWRLHKRECQSLQRWAESHGPSPKPGSSKDVEEEVSVPNEAIRVLGRLIWRQVPEGGVESVYWKEIMHMQSHRSSLSATSEDHTSLTNLAHFLVAYLFSNPGDAAQGLMVFGIESARDLVDILSRFTTNSFTLTTPELSPIGVTVSPLAALFNHSCDPNAVIVLPNPRTPSGSGKVTHMNMLEVVAIRDISPGEEVLTSYIDTVLPRNQRIKELQERYFFQCTCSLCQKEAGVSWTDPREAILCRQKGCGGLLLLPPSSSTPIRCSSCGSSATVDLESTRDAIRLAQEGLEKATGLQFTDPERAQKMAANLAGLLSAASLAPSSHPLLSLSRLHQSLLIDALSAELQSPAATLSIQEHRDMQVDEVCKVAARNVRGVMAVLTEGHPVRGVALAELGKLLCVDVSPNPVSSQASEDQLPRGPARLKLAFETLVRARAELKVGFGGDGGGVGGEVETILKSLEKEASAWRKAVEARAI